MNERLSVVVVERVEIDFGDVEKKFLNVENVAIVSNDMKEAKSELTPIENHISCRMNERE